MSGLSGAITLKTGGAKAPTIDTNVSGSEKPQHEPHAACSSLSLCLRQSHTPQNCVDMREVEQWSLVHVRQASLHRPHYRRLHHPGADWVQVPTLSDYEAVIR